MNRIVTLLLLFSLLICLDSVSAQSKRMLLFEEYSSGKVIFKNRQKIDAKLNYDTANKKIMYLQNGEEMILLNNQQVDSVIISDRKFIALYGVYLEVIALDHSEVFIDWSLKERYKGNRGAYGQITQNKVETINPSYWTNQQYENKYVEIFERENNNNYWFYVDQKPVKCKNVNDLTSIFSTRKEEILLFAKQNSIDFNIAVDALKLINFCLTQ